MSEAQQQRPLALVFTDIEGSSQLWETQGGTFLKALETHDALLTETCREFAGQVVKNEGDAFFLVFEEPRQALQFALRAQQLLQEYDWQQHLPDTLRVRMGLHYGVVFERSGDYFGTEVNRTARVCDAGHGGQILASEELLAACGETPSDAVVTDLARHRLRGLAEPQRLYQITIAHWERQEWPVLRTLDDVPTNLPAQVTSFVGREQDLERVAKLLADPQVRLLTLTGPGGSGKSRLSQEAAARALERFPDGVFWVSLAEFSTVEAVPAAIMEVLKLQPQAGQSPAAIIAAHARDRQLLLVLDNFEHLIEAADFLADLLRLSADIRLLVTSREVLHLQGEQLFHVPTLNLPEPPINWESLSQYDSVRLFLQRAQAVAPDFSITPENAAAIAEICVRLDGIPLALELAAAWVRVYSPAEMLKELGPEARVLTSRVRGVSERQRTLQGALEWSYQLLSPEEQQVFRRLSVFRGGCFREAAVSVCGPEAVEALINLHDKSLVHTREVLGETRFFLLEVVREFAGEKLAEAGEDEETRADHFACYAKCAADLRKRAEEHADERYWSLTVIEGPNTEEAVREAMRSGRMGETELLFVQLAHHASVAHGVAERLLPLAREALEGVTVREGETWPAAAAYLRLFCCRRTHRYEEGMRHAERDFTLADASGVRSLRYACAHFACANARARSDAVRWTRELARWADSAAERVSVAWNLYYLGDRSQGLLQAERALADSAQTDDLYARYETLEVYLRMQVNEARFEVALPHVPELVRLVQASLIGDLGALRRAWAVAVPIVARSGRPDDAAQLAREVVTLQRALDPGMQRFYLAVLLTHCVAGGLWELAGQLAEDHGLQPSNVAGSFHDGGLLAALGPVFARKGDRSQALAAIGPALQKEWFLEDEHDFQGVSGVYGLAEVLRVCGHLPEAVQVAVASARLGEWPLRGILCQELLDLLAAEMPPEALAQAKSKGEKMTGAEAVALTRKTLGV